MEPFIGRRTELELLDTLWQRPAAVRQASGPYWRVTGWDLVDLPQLDDDLARWTP